MEWSPYQQEIFRFIREERDNLVIVARAGSSKTTSLVEGLNHLDPSQKILMCAFNKGIQLELEKRAPGYVNVKTLHGLGYGTLMRRLGKLVVDKDKTRNIIKALVVRYYSHFDTPEILSNLVRLCSLAKNTLTGMVHNPDDPDEKQQALIGLADLAYDFDLDDPEAPAEDLAKVAMDVLPICANIQAENVQDHEGKILLTLLDEETGKPTVDFDDMIWLPPILDIEPARYDVVFADEAQDLCSPQLWLIRQALRDGGRFVGVGDDKQAMYQFRGAGHGVIPSLIKEFKAQILTLPITYRCPLSVVRLAQQYVPDLLPAPWAPEGSVQRCSHDAMVQQVRPGDFVLSRTNAPLMGVCIALLKKHVPATVAGRDIGKSLSGLARKSKKKTVPELMVWLEEYLRKEKERLEPQGKLRRLSYIKDKVQALMILSDGLFQVDQVVDRIDRLFSDGSPVGQVVCSTVHKAKGLERARVWMLADTFSTVDQGEINIKYVAITRSMKELYLVDPPPGKSQRFRF